MAYEQRDLGVVVVDSGTIVIVDVCAAPELNIEEILTDPETVIPLITATGVEIGVVLSTLVGDGTFRITGEFDPSRLGAELRSITIHIADEEEEGDGA